jgi:hypothetical protein
LLLFLRRTWKTLGREIAYFLPKIGSRRGNTPLGENVSINEVLDYISQEANFS